MKKYYIAYGSNLNVRQMKFRCPTAKVVGTSVIKGYELLYKGSKTGSYLTIEKKKGGVVPVAVWEVTARDEKSLDAYEGYPNFYYKKNMKIKLSETGKTPLCTSCTKNAALAFRHRTTSAPADSDIRFSDSISSIWIKPTKKV